ncbi:MAG: BatA domain-containing protein [Flavobacteriales bacterium]
MYEICASELLVGAISNCHPNYCSPLQFPKIPRKSYSPMWLSFKKFKEETAASPNSSIYLILASRILAIICLVFAFAQPYFPTNESEMVQGDKAISLYIDNSFSMDSKADVGRYWRFLKQSYCYYFSAFFYRQVSSIFK